MDLRYDSRRPRDGISSPGETGGYPRRLIAVSARLLEAQYRLWVNDLRDPGQPLIEYGFRLSPDQSGIDGHRCRFDASDGHATILLAETILHGRPGEPAVAVDRRNLTISTCGIHDWRPGPSIVQGAPARADSLVPRLISWIGGYEQWVLDTRGDARRHELLQALGIERNLPSLWWQLAAEWRATLARLPLREPEASGRR